MSDTIVNHALPLLYLTQHGLINYSDWAHELRGHFVLRKVADASFANVYRLISSSNSLVNLPPTPHRMGSVLKIIPLSPPSLEFSKHICESEPAYAGSHTESTSLSTPADVASEIKIMQQLSGVSGYATILSVRVLQGQPPEGFLDSTSPAIEAIRKTQDTFNDVVRINTCPLDQLWAVIEMEDAGSSLETLVESGQFSDIWSVWDVFWQVVLALSRGEDVAQFEHRDLHLGNICISKHENCRASWTSSPSCLRDVVGFTSLKATIVDYTISRATISTGSDRSVAYVDLNSLPLLFDGDSEYGYQYDIYRYMRSAVFFSSPSPWLSCFDNLNFAQVTETTGKSWAGFHPITNVVWLHYLLNMLLSSELPSQPLPSTNVGNRDQEDCENAIEVKNTLRTVQGLLDLASVGGNEIASASDLANLALGNRWLRGGTVGASEGSATLYNSTSGHGNQIARG